MGDHQLKLKLKPLPIEKRDKALVPKLLGQHHPASAIPFWAERVKEAKESKANPKVSKTLDEQPQTLFLFHQPFSRKQHPIFNRPANSGIVTYPAEFSARKLQRPKPQSHFSSLSQFELRKRRQFLRNFVSHYPDLGLSVDQLLKLELIGASNTDQWIKHFIIWLNGGLNPHYHYGEFAYGYAEPGQIRRLTRQELKGRGPLMEAKLLQDRQSLGLPPLEVQEHHRPKLRPHR